MSSEWQTLRLGDIADTRRAVGGLSQADLYVGLEHLRPGNPRIQGTARAADVLSSTTPFEPGDVLFGKLRPYLRKVAVADFVGCCTNEILVFKPIDEQVLSRGFLALILQSAAAFEHAVSMSAGSRMPRTSYQAMAELGVSLPPWAEQRRIVDLIGAVDDAIDAMQEASARNRESFKAIAESLPGQLTPLDEVLLAIEAGKSPSGVEREPAPGERAVLKVSAIGSGTFNAMEVKVVSPDTRLDERTAISRGDVLMVRANGVIKRVGAVCQVREDYEQLFLCDKTLRLVPDPDRLDSRWLNSALSSTQSRRQIEALTTGSHMRNITQQAIRQIKIPLPNIDEQTMLSAALESLIEARDALYSHTDKLAALRAELLAVLLSGAHRIPETYDELMGA
ncbi:restriction endonuclease subunit S [Arthrobacter sp. MMS24-S77]